MTARLGGPKTCPHCSVVNPSEAARCDCGFDLSAPVEPSRTGMLVRLRQSFARLLGRKTRVGPKEMAHMVAAVAMAHLRALAEHLELEQAEDEWTDAAHELIRAYFGLASLHAGRCIRDEEALNRFGVSMLAELRAYAEAGGELIRTAFEDDAVMEHSIRLYVNGRPADEDAAAVRESATLLSIDLDDANPVVMLGLHAHVRSMRSLGIERRDLRYIGGWMVTASRITSAMTKLLGDLVPVAPAESSALSAGVGGVPPNPLSRQPQIVQMHCSSRRRPFVRPTSLRPPIGCGGPPNWDTAKRR